MVAYVASSPRLHEPVLPMYLRGARETSTFRDSRRRVRLQSLCSWSPACGYPRNTTVCTPAKDVAYGALTTTGRFGVSASKRKRAAAVIATERKQEQEQE